MHLDSLSVARDAVGLRELAVFAVVAGRRLGSRVNLLRVFMNLLHAVRGGVVGAGRVPRGAHLGEGFPVGVLRTRGVRSARLRFVADARRVGAPRVVLLRAVVLLDVLGVGLRLGALAPRDDVGNLLGASALGRVLARSVAAARGGRRIIFAGGVQAARGVRRVHLLSARGDRRRGRFPLTRRALRRAG